MTSKTIDAMMAEHAAAIERREAARDVFATADADLLGLTQIIREQGSAGLPGSSLAYRIDWLRAAERASEALFATLLPEASQSQIVEAYARWKATLSRLPAA